MNSKHSIFFLMITLFFFMHSTFALPALTNQNGVFKDEANRTFILHGLNEMNKQPPYTPDVIGFDQQSMQFFKEYGFNVVRLGIFWNAIEPFPGFYDKYYLLKIKQTIQQLNENGIYTLIDFHQDGYSKKYQEGLGAPVWAALSPSEKGRNAEFPINLFGGIAGISLATDHDIDAFWQNKVGPKGQLLQQSYSNMVKMVSQYFLLTPGIIGYEIMNEPFPGSTWPVCYNRTISFRVGCPQFDTDVLSPFYATITNSIRSIDKKRIIFYEPNVFFDEGAPSFVLAPKDNNMGFSFHNYYNENPKQAFENASQHVAITGSVPLMTEFGAALTTTDQFSQIVELADQYNMSWMEWAYTNNPGYKIAVVPHVPADPKEQGIVYDAKFPLKNKNVKWDRLYILSRVYPEIVAGKIYNYQYISSSKRFTLKFATKDSMRKMISTNPYSKIIIPPYIYPHGYTVQVEGAKIISTIYNNLILKNDDTADTVDVLIFQKEMI